MEYSIPLAGFSFCLIIVLIIQGAKIRSKNLRIKELERESKIVVTLADSTASKYLDKMDTLLREARSVIAERKKGI
jgi:hypothetical protein